jgi:hypothetical protein
MFWVLLLAHFLADYPFQPTWIVRNKNQFAVLGLHAGIHFAVMLVLAWPGAAQIWVYLLLLTSIHFGIDAVKNWFAIHRPSWTNWAYIIDQLFHILSIGGVAAWIDLNQAGVRLPISKSLAIYALGFLLVTYVWLISERVFRRSVSEMQNQGLVRQDWSRLWVRMGMLAVVLAGWRVYSSGLLSLVLPTPYATEHGLRELWIDILVVMAVACIVIIGNG